MATSLKYYNRAKGILEEEKVLGDSLLRFAYTNPLGKILHIPLFASAFFSRLLGYYADSGISRKRIAKTIEQLEIDMSEFELPAEGFRTFNDFFTRKLKAGSRSIATAANSLISPADCRLLVYPKLSGDTCIPVKGKDFTVRELLGNNEKALAEEFENGSLCICRLCPADYHRYHFPDDGELLKNWQMKGKYHSVSPIATTQNIKAFTENYRQNSLLQLKNFGKMIFCEVGAFAVASIVQTCNEKKFHKGQEKGFFAFGGSTIIMVFAENKVKFAEDILQKSAENIECLVKMGEEIGVSC